MLAAVVEHMTHNPKIMGSRLANSHQDREISKKKFKSCYYIFELSMGGRLTDGITFPEF
jgi:hypothetical protein